MKTNKKKWSMSFCVISIMIGLMLFTDCDMNQSNRTFQGANLRPQENMMQSSEDRVRLQEAKEKLVGTWWEITTDREGQHTSGYYSGVVRFLPDGSYQSYDEKFVERKYDYHQPNYRIDMEYLYFDEGYNDFLKYKYSLSNYNTILSLEYVTGITYWITPESDDIVRVFKKIE